MHRRLDHEQRRSGHTDGGVDVVDLAAGLHHRRDLDRLGEGDAPGDELVPAQSHPQRKVATDGVAHGGDDLQQDPRPVGKVAAVTVAPPVRCRGEEAAHDGGVAALELDAVEATLPAACRDIGIAGHDLGDLGVGDRLWHLAEEGVGDR